jgi:hypothetical protein
MAQSTPVVIEQVAGIAGDVTELSADAEKP